MRIGWIVALLLLGLGLIACNQQSEELAETIVEKQAEEQSIRSEIIYSAQLFNYRVQRGKSDDAGEQERDDGIGWADAATLLQLEEILLRPRITTTRYYLGGYKGSVAYGCRPQKEIHVTLQDGSKFLVILFCAVDLWWVRDEPDFILNRSSAEAKAMMDESGWQAQAPPPLEPGALPEGLILPATHLFEEDLVLSSPLNEGYDEMDEEFEVLSARRFQPGIAEDGQAAADIDLGEASANILRDFKHALNNGRFSLLRYFMNGDVYAIPLRDEPTDWIDCWLDDGKVIRILHYGPDGPWIVEGEGEFELIISASASEEILDSSEWKT